MVLTQGILFSHGETVKNLIPTMLVLGPPVSTQYSQAPPWVGSEKHVPQAKGSETVHKDLGALRGAVDADSAEWAEPKE